MKEIKQLPSFNGWRAVSILLVLGSHTCLVNGFPLPHSRLVHDLFDGVLGVQCFFTISGFLITWLMLQEERKFGSMSLKNFYIRRALRIFPVYFAYLAVLGLIQIIGIQAQSRFTWFQLLTFTRNFYQTGHAEDTLSSHFWSLSVEEQFYLVWPFIFRWLGRSGGRRMKFLTAAIVFAIGNRIIALLGYYNRHLFFLFEDNSTFQYMDCLSYGCMGAILLDAHRERLALFFGRFPLLVFSLSCFGVVVPEIVGLGRGLQAFGFIFLLLQSVLFPEFKPFRVLNNRWMVKIGILSYSLYIWQQLVFGLWPVPRLWVLWLPVTFGLAWLSYTLLEKPFLSLRSKFREPRSA